MNPFASGQRSFAVRKMMHQFLGDRYHKHDVLVQRVAASLVTDQDVADFAALVTDVFEAAYLRCVDDHEEQLKKAGVNIRVVRPRNEAGSPTGSR